MESRRDKGRAKGTLQWMDVHAGRSEPIDDLLEMIEEDSRNGSIAGVSGTEQTIDHTR